MSFRSDLAAGVAFAHLQLAGALGAQLTYVSRGLTYTVQGIPKSGATSGMRVTGGTRAQENARSFEIAAQTSVEGNAFPPLTGPMGDDTIADAKGLIFAVRRWDNPDDIGAVYRFDGVQTKVKQVGVVGQ